VQASPYLPADGTNSSVPMLHERVDGRRAPGRLTRAFCGRSAHVGAGINAPPMTFEAGGKQYVTVMTGLSRASKGRITLTPELRDMRDQTMLFVFGL
jgi:hypothetical protein